MLAAALAAENEWRAVRETNPKAIELSRLLRAAASAPEDARPPSFRSPGSIQRKIYDIITQHPGYTGKRTRDGRLDASVLQEFLSDPERMSSLAHKLRAQMVASAQKR